MFHISISDLIMQKKWENVVEFFMNHMNPRKGKFGKFWVQHGSWDRLDGYWAFYNELQGCGNMYVTPIEVNDDIGGWVRIQGGKESNVAPQALANPESLFPQVLAPQSPVLAPKALGWHWGLYLSLPLKAFIFTLFGALSSQDLRMTSSSGLSRRKGRKSPSLESR